MTIFSLFHRVTLLDHLVCYLGKAITVQVKVKGTSGATPTTVTMGGSVGQAAPATWFMRGDTTKKHAHLVAKLLSDMAEVRFINQSFWQKYRLEIGMLFQKPFNFDLLYVEQ